MDHTPRVTVSMHQACAEGIAFPSQLCLGCKPGPLVHKHGCCTQLHAASSCVPTSEQDVGHLDEPDALHDDEHGPRGCQKEVVGAAHLPHNDNEGGQDRDYQQGVHPYIQLVPLQAQ